MDNNVTTSEKITKWLLIGISVLFLAVMLLLPLLTVITEALRSGWKVYAAAVTDEYTIKALLLTVKATLFAVIFNTIFGVFAAWALTKFQFRGKKTADNSDRSSGYHLPGHCRSDLSSDFRATKSGLLFPFEIRNQGCIFCTGNHYCNCICNLSFYFQRTDSGSGSRRKR